MVATNEKGGFPFFLDKSETHNKNKLHLNEGDHMDNWNWPVIQQQHLCILSNEPIKIGDLYYNPAKSQFGEPHIERCEYDHEAKACLNKPVCQKVIASTDKSLGLPEIPYYFVCHFIDLYNKGTLISEVHVEVDGSNEDMQRELIGLSPLRVLKVNPDNTVSLRILHFQWDDDKVIDFVNWYIKLKKLDFRYSLENQEIIESFKRGDKPEDWNLNPFFHQD